MQLFPVWLHNHPYIRLLRLHQPTGVWLLLWPCWWSIALATPKGQLPDATLLLIFAVGSLLMRAAGCIINDLLDRKIDAQVARTKTRPLASGEITPKQALRVLGILLLLAGCLLIPLNQKAQLLALLSLVPVCLYPLMKRWFAVPQLFLGLTFNWGALMGGVAASGEFRMEFLWLYLASLCWTLGYDTIYALQDLKDDARIGVKSSALFFGESVRPAVQLSYALCVLLLGLLRQDAAYLAGLFVFASLLFMQALRVKLADPTQAMATFRLNALAGAFPFIGLVWSLYV